MSDAKGMRLMLAEVIEALAATDRRVEGLTASLLAIRATLAEMGADFENRYAKHFAEPEVQQLIQRCTHERDLLLQIARRLRTQS
jgi:hypothetical protein